MSKEIFSKPFDDKWIAINNCPSCSSSTIKNRWKLAGEEYYYHGKKHPFPNHGIDLLECNNCGLIYKSIVPSPDFLSQLFSERSGSIWSSPYMYKDEINLIKGLANSKSFDVLDIGAGNSKLLNACSDWGGRRSVLDLISYPHIENDIQGEFIKGLIDDSNIVWSLEPYDFITLFDVLEHLYDANIAFENINKLSKNNGFLIIETGNSEQFEEVNSSYVSWSYCMLIEHHVFWNRKSIEYQAKNNGFEIVSWENKLHKSFAITSKIQKLKNIILVSLFNNFPEMYRKIAKITGQRTFPPRSKFKEDHFRVVLRKI